MLRRTKILIAVYCVAGVFILGMAVAFVLQVTDWWGHPERYKEFTHHHHHGGEPVAPETGPAETYAADAKTFLRVPFQDENFDVTQSCVELSEILEVSLDWQKLPDLEELKFVSADESLGLLDEDTVIGVSIEGEDKAYPVRMLNSHVVVNDVCAGKEIAVVWDPLTLTPKVFRRKLEKGGESMPLLTFGKLALLHKGAMLLYDEPRRGIWWPPEGKCLTGELSGACLTGHPFLLISWKTWKELHPTTSVLSMNTPFHQKYSRNSFNSYYGIAKLPVPVEGWDGRESPFKWSEPVIALEREGNAKAYPLSVLGKVEGSVEDTFAGGKVVFREPKSRPPYPTDEKGQEIPYSFGA